MNRQRSSKLYNMCISWRTADTTFLFRCWWLHTNWYCTSAKTFAVSKFDDVAQSWLELLTYQKLMTTKWLRYQQLSRSAQWILFQDVYLLSNFMLHDRVVATHQYLCFGPMESSPKAMTLSCPRHISRFKVEVHYTLAKKPCKNVSHHGWPTKKNLVSWIIIRT